MFPFQKGYWAHNHLEYHGSYQAKWETIDCVTLMQSVRNTT